MSKSTPNSSVEAISRCIKIDNWIFEIKAVRAIRVEEYGQPYSAIANININGDKAYIDGLMTDSAIEFDREDYESFKSYLQHLNISKVEFDRYKNKEPTSKSIDVPPLSTNSSTLQLVS
jgi:hypothetical protein